MYRHTSVRKEAPHRGAEGARDGGTEGAGDGGAVARAAMAGLAVGGCVAVGALLGANVGTWMRAKG